MTEVHFKSLVIFNLQSFIHTRRCVRVLFLCVNAHHVLGKPICFKITLKKVAARLLKLCHAKHTVL